MEEVFLTVLKALTAGGSVAVIVLLFIAVLVLVWDRLNLCKQITATTQLVYVAKDNETASIKEIIERYHKGNIDLVNALNEIKMVLLTLQSRK